MTELIKKLPTLLAIAGLSWALHESLQLGIDAAYRLMLTTAIAGLGGFYLRDVLDRRAPRS